MTSAKAFCLFIVAAAVVASCGKLQEKPVVDFAMKDFRVETHSNCSEDDSIPCAYFKIQYPVFLSLDSNVRKAINDKVGYALNGNTGDPRTIEQTGEDFIKDYKDISGAEPDYTMSWYYDSFVEVMLATDTLISLKITSEVFSGGAHGSYTSVFVNVDPKTGTSYLLDALLRTGYEDELYRLAEEDLFEQLGMDPDSIGPPRDPEDRFTLTGNYGFRKEGIVFYYNAEDLPSFAEQPAEILIPYELLTDWIR
jgi:hypothetical protein